MKIERKYKICRRLKSSIFEKCQTTAFTKSEQRIKNKKTDKRPKAPSEYGLQLIEKQKVRFGYGITERQLSNYIQESLSKKGSIQDHLYELLENRLDNIVYRLGLAHTRRLARQMVSHGHFKINGVRTTVPSYQVKINDVVTVRDGSRTSPLFTNIVEKAKQYKVPAWLSLKPEAYEATVLGKPKNTEGFLNLSSVFEFYSR